MKQLLSALAVGAAAVALAITPAITASAAPAAPAAPAASAKHYTLTVDGDGKHASVVWTSLKVKSDGTAPTPKMHAVATAREPWKKHVAAGADLYEVVAIQTTGSTLSCTIKNIHGKVVAHSTSHGKNTVVTCIVTTDALLAASAAGSAGDGAAG